MKKRLERILPHFKKEEIAHKVEINHGFPGTYLSDDMIEGDKKILTPQLYEQLQERIPLE